MPRAVSSGPHRTFLRIKSGHHKYEERLAKDISTLQAETDMLQPGERNRFNEDRGSVIAELALLRKLAGDIETFNQRQMRQTIERMARRNETEEGR